MGAMTRTKTRIGVGINIYGYMYCYCLCMIPILRSSNVPVCSAFRFYPASLAILPISQLSSRTYHSRGLPTRAILFQSLLTANGDNNGGDSASGGGAVEGENISPGKDNEVSKALNLIHKGMKLYQELDSKEVDEDDEEMQETLELSKNTSSTEDINQDKDSLPQPIQQMQQEIEAFQNKAKRTRIVLLRKMAAWAFETCNEGKSDGESEEKINRDAFYSGILLVHLHLAKYVGVAACNPPTRDQIDELFLLADSDCSGALSKEKFTEAVIVAMAPITSRIAIYYTVLALLPLLVNRCIAAFTYIMENQIIGQVPEHIYGKALAVLEWVFNNIFSVTIFSIVLPFVFGKVDLAARRYARKRYQQPLWWLKMPKHPNTPQSWSTWFRQRHSALQDSNFWSASTTSNAKKSNTDQNSGGEAKENKRDQKEAKDWQWTKWWPNLIRKQAK